MSPTLRMIFRRLGLGLLTLVVVSIVIFVSVELLPGDTAQALLGQSATPEALAALRRDMGLDQPAVVRYLDWLWGMMQGDLGRSVLNREREIVDMIGPKLGNTFFLAGVTAAIAIPLSLMLGIMAALFRNSLFDRTVNMVTLTSISFPEFFVAYILALYLAVEFGLLPRLSNIPEGASFSERVYYTMMPALTLTLVITAHMMRMTRAAIINLLAAPYIEMARLKGASQMSIIVRHALPNALAPIVNVIALNLAYLITGVVVVEVVFVYPGLGQLLVDNVAKRDVTVVQAACLIFAATYILLNLIADVLSIITNPRLLHPK